MIDFQIVYSIAHKYQVHLAKQKASPLAGHSRSPAQSEETIFKINQAEKYF